MRRLLIPLLLLLLAAAGTALWAVFGRPNSVSPDDLPRTGTERVTAAAEPLPRDDGTETQGREPPTRRRVRIGASEEATADAARRLAEIAELRRKQEAELAAERQRLRRLASPVAPSPVGDAKDGPFVAFHESGEVFREGFFVDGEKHGLWSETFPSGGRTETEYRLGEKHGREAAWHPDGSIKYLGGYRDGEIHGTWTVWHDNSVVAMTRTFVDGVLEGLLRRFHENGVLAEESWFRDGLETGMNRGWHDNGTLAWENEYSAGKRNGRATWWDREGRLELETTFLDGSFHGAWIEYTPDGDVKGRATYDRGELVTRR